MWEKALALQIGKKASKGGEVSFFGTVRGWVGFDVGRELEGGEGFEGEIEPRALLPLIYAHVDPYGTFKLDMTERLALGAAAPIMPLNLGISGYYFAVCDSFAHNGPCCSVGDTDQPEITPSACGSDLMDFTLQLDAEQFEPEPPKFNQAGFGGDLKIRSSLDDSSVDSIFAHLSGRELRGSFSRALICSSFSDAEKGWILNEVSGLVGY